jgi:Flp pilus assembly protein TadG
MNRKARQRGATLLMVTFVATFLLIPIIGTCIDGAVLYWVKARLSAAVDASALATARSLNVGQTVAAQECNATQLGANYFNANFPAGVMRTTLVGTQDLSTCPGNTRIVINETAVHMRTVTVTVSVTVPTFFMRILGFNNSTVAATGQAARRDSNIMLVLDRSNSMNNSSGSCSALGSAALTFVNQFVEGRDQVGLVTFQTGANVDFEPSLTFKSALTTALNSMRCGGDTSTAQGLYLAYDRIKNTINQPGALNVILLFTDGEPNGLVADFVIKTQTDTRYDAQNYSQPVSTGPSSCQVPGPLRGVIADGSGETAADVTGLNQYGYTVAILSSTGVPISNTSNPTTLSGSIAKGCSFSNSDWTYSIYGRTDIAAIPTQDAYGNSLLDRPSLMPALDTFKAGNYIGSIRPDMPRTVRWASFNAADSMAQTIRNNSTYTTQIYTIGLASNETMAIDQDFMKRLANDPTAPAASNYDSTKPQGMFILAGNNAEMAQAFQQIASQILRLSQ